jgi:hypothetical protein
VSVIYIKKLAAWLLATVAPKNLNLVTEPTTGISPSLNIFFARYKADSMLRSHAAKERAVVRSMALTTAQSLTFDGRPSQSFF